MVDLGKIMLDSYGPRALEIDCTRCRRHVHLTTDTLRKKFGNQPLGVLARMVARAGTTHLRGGCGLAEDPFKPLCNARPIEARVTSWACIADAEQGCWRALLHCERRHAGLKSTKSCTEITELPVLVLKAIYGYGFPLEKLQRVGIRCPYCGTPMITIEWIVPAQAPDPGGATGTEEPVLQLRPTGAALGRRQFRIIGR